MKIEYIEQSKKFAIQLPDASYFMQIDDEDVLRNLYWGKKIENPEDVELEVPVSTWSYSRAYPYREEFICRGKTSFDEPCILAEFADGTRDVRLVYQCHEILELDDGMQLTIILKDEFYPLEVGLCYRIYNGLNLITKNAVIKNAGNEEIVLTKMKSGTMYTAWGHQMKLTYLAGKYFKEYQKKQTVLEQGRFVLDQRRGACSGPTCVPLFILDEGDACETHGDVWFGTLHWSGNYKIEFEYSYTEQLTVTAGINDFDCNIILKSRENFETPLFTIGFSDRGYEKVTETLYDYQFDFFLPRSKINKIFPVIYNTWFPFEMDVNEENCISLIEKAKDVGAELFVIDDGWFKNRNDDHSGLGDWECNKMKFPNGLKIVSEAAHNKGMLFGLWVEPEMISENSDLFRMHPEWVLQYPNRSKTKFRNQCILNLASEEVYKFVLDTVDRMIEEYDLDYIKWDMNAYISEAGSALMENQKEVWTKFIKNLYRIWEKINEKHPDVFLECCAHGGARTDYGMLKYCDRINRSDNSDAVDVLKLHEGFASFVLPKLAGGAGNLSSSPNGINGRRIPLKYRAYIGMIGDMSIGINLLKISQDELREIKKYVAYYKQIREITQKAYFYKLSSAFENNYVVWAYLERTRKKAVIFIFGHGMNFRDIPPRARLRGLDAEKKYKVSGVEHYYKDEAREVRSDLMLGGDSLMNFGLQVEPRGDYDCQIITVEEI